jgi:hypothetical protein
MERTVAEIGRHVDELIAQRWARSQGRSLRMDLTLRLPLALALSVSVWVALAFAGFPSFIAVLAGGCTGPLLLGAAGGWSVTRLDALTESRTGTVGALAAATCGVFGLVASFF